MTKPDTGGRAGEAGRTASEQSLLEWLAKEDFSQYGECHGKSLDRLVELGLAQIHGPGEHQHFTAKGCELMYRAVSLTDAGRAVLSAKDGR